MNRLKITITGLIGLGLLVGCQPSVDNEKNQGNNSQLIEADSNEKSIDLESTRAIIEKLGSPQKVEVITSSMLKTYVGARNVDKVSYEQIIPINDQCILLYITDRWAIFDENFNFVKELNVTPQDSFSDKYFIYKDESNNYGTMDINGEILIPADSKYKEFTYNIYGNHFLTFFKNSDNQHYLITDEGRSVELVDLVALEHLYPSMTTDYSDDDLVALYNPLENKNVTDYIYDSINTTERWLDNDKSFYVAVLDGLSGVIDSTGEVLLDFEYEEIKACANGQVIVKDVSTGEFSIYDLNQQKFVAEGIPSEYDTVTIHEVSGMGQSRFISDYRYTFTSWLTEETLLYEPTGELVYTAPSPITVMNYGSIYYTSREEEQWSPTGNTYTRKYYTVLDESYKEVFKNTRFDDIAQLPNGLYVLYDSALNVSHAKTRNGSIVGGYAQGYDIKYLCGDYILVDGKIYQPYTKDNANQ